MLPKLPPPDSGRYRVAERRWLVLDQPPSPTTDYYVRPRAARAGVPVSYRSIHEPPRVTDLVVGTLVIVVRYLSPAWARALAEAEERLAGFVYLMDDDLLDPGAWRGLPLAYQWRLWRHGRVLWPVLARMASSYWMSTPALVQRYARLAPRLTPPLPLCEDMPQPGCGLPRPREPVARDEWLTQNTGLASAWRNEPVLLFYHGTRSHLAEMLWLVPVVTAALEACPQLHFEIVGDVDIQRRFRHLPRTRVLHPMPWPAYLAYCRWLARQQPGQRIGLAPLLPSRFNAARSHTRVLDITRCRAAGLYAQGQPYAGVIRHGHDGLLLPPEPAAWVAAIQQLSQDRALRLHISLAAAAQAALAGAPGLQAGREV